MLGVNCKMPGPPRQVYLYRITHKNNLTHILASGICNKNHPNADPGYIPIGNGSIIGVRTIHPAKIEGYGNIGEYVPFYFTPSSIMLYNILTGYGVPKIEAEDIVF